MPTTEKLRNKLLNKLTELFQLDQPDLDFGFYRVMHAKAQQVKSFIDKDLLQIIEDAFGQVDESRKAELAAAVEKAIQTAKDFGAPNPEETEPVKKAKAALADLRDGATAESDVYDHLYRFFERYYDEGDFISRRYYARENAGKAAPFAIPYNGEEVKLHWANADQYYIKTAEYFSNYSFDMTQAAEIRKMSDEEKVLNGITEKTLKVHFRIIEASEGEHGNVKAAEDKKRFFILHEENPVEFIVGANNDSPELVINFEYKALASGKNDVDADTEKALKEKYGKSLNKGNMPNLAIAEKVIEAASGLANAKEYLSALGLYAPTAKIPNRPLLAKYINQYTARNTCDYFIHKDLSGFLKRELDFYIKNEVMHLDDIENADAPAVETYLAKLKVIRKIATKLIDFLAQLEDFQKKLWLKKKFVTETNYCITLDRVPKELYEEIASNDSQREEWVKLFAIDEIKGDAGGLSGMGSPAYSIPLTTDFLKANDKLVLDTAFFSNDFKARLIASIEDFDQQCDGLLIHSENFQALNLLQERYREQVKCVYIDPPYNTGKDGFLYKDTYQHSTWNSFIFDRLNSIHNILDEKGALFASIDDNEANNLEWVCNQIFGENHLLAPFFIQVRYANKTLSEDNDFQRTVERVFFYAKEKKFKPIKDTVDYPVEKFEWKITELSEGAKFSAGGKACQVFKPGEFIIEKVKSSFTGLKETWATGSLLRQKGSSGEFFGLNLAPRKATDGLGCLYKVDGIGEDGLGYRYFTGPQRESATKGKFYSGIPLQTLEKIKSGDATKEVPIHNFYDFAGDFGNCRHEGSVDISGGKKPEVLIKRLIDFVVKNNSKSVILDPFAGSGTTPSVSKKLGQEFVGIEQSSYFDNKVLVRMKYTLNGASKGIEFAATGGFFKYIRLESYEDTLNNLVFDENPVRCKAVESNPSLKEDYMLRYLLDVETQGSQSLLNIDAFADPTAYSLVVKKPGSDEQATQNIDLIETFSYLLGLRLENMAAPQTFTASFTRQPDPELPEDQHTKLVVDGKIRLITTENTEYTEKENINKNNSVSSVCSVVPKSWWFRKVEGWVPADPMKPNNGVKERVLIVWRKLTGNLEEDNLMLDEWFEKYRISTRDFEYDTIYVNGSNNLPNLKKDDENWKVRLIEEEFHKKMWAVE